MFKILDEACKPTRGTKFSACVDLYAREDVVIGAGETKIVPLGVKIDLEYFREKFKTNYADDGTHGNDFSSEALRSQLYRLMDYEMFLKSHCLELKCRSSLPLKKGLIMANGVGEIDLDYPDEIGILLHNSIEYDLVEAIACQEVLVSIDGRDRFIPNTERAEVNIKKGKKIAQIKLVEHKSYLFGIESDSERSGGFGSTGVG